MTKVLKDRPRERSWIVNACFALIPRVLARVIKILLFAGGLFYVGLGLWLVFW